MEPSQITLMIDKLDYTAYRVEAIYADGSVDVSIFSGPNAVVNAINFACTYVFFMTRMGYAND